MTHATGPFDVKLTPQETGAVARMLIAKQYHGDLEAAGEGQMLAAGTETKGSAGYVAIERVTGTLNGRKGSFILQHHGLMDRGVPSLMVTIVPDSGTGELAGLKGKMDIKIDAGKHSYELEYSL
jgi:hypothetical protein